MFVKIMQTLLVVTGKFENPRAIGSSQCADLVLGGLMARYCGPFCNRKAISVVDERITGNHEWEARSHLSMTFMCGLF